MFKFVSNFVKHPPGVVFTMFTCSAQWTTYMINPVALKQKVPFSWSQILYSSCLK